MKSRNQENHSSDSGYKQTEVGVIPEEWAVSSLQDACRETITYGIVQCGPHIRNGIPYVRVSDMDKPELDVDGMLRTSSAIAGRFSRSTVQQGDLVYALRGKLGEVRQVTSSVAGANLTQGTARLSPKEGIISDYLMWAMRSSRVVGQAEIEAKGTTFREITLAELRRICLPVPPLPEQRAIATALSDVDALIASLDKLIAKKRDIKQGAMQQLLTGKTRLPGFSGEWEMRRLGDVTDVDMGQSPVGSSYNKDGLGAPLINGPTEFTEKYPVKNQWTSLPTKFCKKGDVLLCVRGSSTGRINISNDEYCIGRGVAAIRARMASDTVFITFQLYAAIQSILALTTGSTFPNIDAKSIRNIEISVPSLPEQQAIATVLSDMDADITALETRSDKTKLLKRGMMQELLTGRIRLI